MKNLIPEAELFIENNYKGYFPSEISAPVMANFAEAIIGSGLNLSKEDLYKQVNIFITEEELEEFEHCIEYFAYAVVDFTSSLIPNQTEIISHHC